MKTRNSGLVLIDKPQGLTSQQAVARVRHALGGVRAGHTGTLDPFATGLLIVLTGRATRLAPFVADEPKEYEATFRFGAETDTDDATGQVVRTAGPPAAAVVGKALTSLTGEIEQVPPAYSAKQVGGVRAYSRARAGAPLELPPVTVRVHSIEIVRQTETELRTRIVCSGGTYIRALARDVGRLTKSAAHCATLRRLRCGPFSVKQAVLPDAAQPEDVLAPLAALPDFPVQRLAADAALGVLNGRATDAVVAGDWAALVRDEDELLAIAQREGDQWQPRVVVAAPLLEERPSLPQ